MGRCLDPGLAQRAQGPHREPLQVGGGAARRPNRVGEVRQDGVVMPASVQQSLDNFPEKREVAAPDVGAVMVTPRLSEAFFAVDLEEQFLAAKYPAILKALLLDRTTGRNIVWATDQYAHLGRGYQPSDEITPGVITGVHARVIQPRIRKAKVLRSDRTRGRGEVFTPSWLCNQQNNQCDDVWFGRSGVFNEAAYRSWKVRPEPVRFELRGDRTWQMYVDERRMEAACGEAPYLVSRYDTTTGEPIPLARRIGLLDRKLRVVTENASDDAEWSEWARRAFESVYGFEFQGDNLLLARENLFATYVESAVGALGTMPSLDELARVAEIISWNIWQMDALTCHPPLQVPLTHIDQLGLFDDERTEVVRPCMVRDWRELEVHRYQDLARPGHNGRD